MPAETLYPHVDGSGRGMDDGDCIHCGVSGSLEGAECPVRMRKLIRRMERWQPYDEHGQPVTQAAYNALVSRLATEGERMETIARLTRERDDLRVELDEARAWEKHYQDIVNRTARALGIPEVDEAGASPSLHGVPERVGRLVASDAEFRRWVSTGRDGCPPYSSDVAWQLQRLDESFKALHDGAEVVRGERNKLIGDIEMLGYMLGIGSDDDTSPEAVLRFAERLNRGSEPTDNDATQDPPGWGVCGKVIHGTERTVGSVTSAHGCMDEPGHDGPCRFDARADGGEVPDAR